MSFSFLIFTFLGNATKSCIEAPDPSVRVLVMSVLLLVKGRAIARLVSYPFTAPAVVAEELMGLTLYQGSRGTISSQNN